MPQPARTWCLQAVPWPEGAAVTGATTLIDKIWDQHVIRELSDGRTLLHIDRHLIHDGSSRQAFDGLRSLDRKLRNLPLNFAVVDHIVSTQIGRASCRARV